MLLNGSAANGIESPAARPSTAYPTVVNAKPPINSIVKNSPFIINNNFHNHNHINITQRRNTFDGGFQLNRSKKTTTAHIKSALISSKIKQYCDNTSNGGEQLKNNQYTTNNYHNYMNKKNLANNKTSGSIGDSGHGSMTMKTTMTAASSLPAIATMTSNTRTTVVVSATKRLTNGNRIVAPSHNYSNSALQDEDLINIDVKNLVSNFACMRMHCTLFIVLIDM